MDISSFLRNFWTWWRNGHLTCITSRQLSLPRSIDSTEIGTTQCCWERSGSCELLIVTSWKISLKCNQHLFSDMKKKTKHQERKKLKANNHYFSAQGRFHKFKLICAHQYPKYPHQMVTGAIPPLMTSHCRCSTLKFYFFLKIICILTCFDIDRFFSDVNLMTWNYWN